MLNESIGEDAALVWLGELGYTVGHGRRAWDRLAGMDKGEEK